MSENPGAILFDFGGTLFSYRSIGAKSIGLLQRAAERLGVSADLPTLGRAYREASRAAYKEFAPRPYYLHRDLFVDTFRRFAESLGTDPSPAYLDWHHEEQRSLLLESFELRPDCKETLDVLRGRGLHVGVVSNIDDDYLGPMIRQAELDTRLDSWTSSEEAASCKPDSRIFEHALAKAGMEPGRVVFVGDSREHDVAGARAMGMTTVLITEPDASPPGEGVGDAPEPDHVIQRLGELLVLVDGAEG